MTGVSIPRVRGGAAAATFALAVAAALPVILYQGRELWFAYDDWYVLAEGRLGRPASLLEPHNEHLVVSVRVLYRLLFRAVGIRHHWPYQLVAVVSHLAIAVLLRAVMRRLLVPGWIATAALLPYLVYGAGRHNVTTAFQVTNSAPVALGLASLLLVDHDGPSDRRDLAGTALIVAALGMSGIGIAMLAATSTAILLRRGVPATVRHVVPPLVLYLAWYLAYRPPGVRSFAPGPNARFVWFTIADALVGLGQFLVVGVLAGGLVAVGTIALLTALRDPAARHRLAPLVATTVGLAAFLAMTAMSRGWLFGGHLGGIPTRYVHIAAALLLPLLAHGATVVVERWPRIHPIVLVVLVAGVPGNIEALEPTAGERLATGNPMHVVALAMATEEVAPPDDMLVDVPRLRVVTAGWLREQWRAGRLPSPSVPPETLDVARLAVSFAPEPGPSRTGCGPAPPRPARLSPDQSFWVSGGDLTVIEIDDDRSIGPVTVSRDPRRPSSTGTRFRALRELTVAAQPTLPNAEVLLCR